MSKVYKEDFAYPIEANRYRLAFAFPCPYAQRAEIARRLLGLDKVIGLALTSSIKTKRIWDFSNQKDGKDPVLGVEFVSELYKNTDPDYEGPFSVPALVDTTNNQVVNSESLDILRDFTTRFKPLHGDGAPDLYPKDIQKEVDEWIQWVITNVLGRASGAGYTRSQEEFDENAKAYFKSLKELDQHFFANQFLLGDRLTEADIVLYTPLIRHDLLYYPIYGLFQYKLQDLPNLWRYVKNLYQIPAFKEATNFKEYQIGQYSGKTGRAFFKREVVPMLPDMSYWDEK
ncbi:glutathione S-transferase C-terminal domain-containing protein [Facklamia miroungae]|uniref:Putative glutathione S-transferase n=1 Tax=Facklamia miroungae TaxID=120956 RepID=A0A1G7QS72_9LACT|nr:glutathione S-transferase C-terminal domain-containing protein [Facklamia miroungae]NKZ29045.1 glutathione S-transferase family protein [Facklamia miroungae]SDG01376.1 putative glutathione S-transferase [Facklamia miroungae]